MPNAASAERSGYPRPEALYVAPPHIVFGATFAASAMYAGVVLASGHPVPNQILF